MKVFNTARFGGVLLALVALFLTGCASLGPVYTPVASVPQDKAVIYIYRSPSFVGGAVSYDVHDGENGVVTSLPNGGYYPYIRSPGEVEIWAKTESKSSVTLDLKAGDVKYVKGTLGVGVLVGRPHLSVVSDEVGQSEIKECKMIPKKN